MSRSGYSDDGDSDYPLALWRGAVASAIRGKRGQAFLKEMLAALDAMPAKRLINGRLIENGEACAIGAVGLARGIDMNKLDPEHYDAIAKVFGIPEALVREIEFENDDQDYWGSFTSGEWTPERRFERMRAWVVKQLEGS
jgi:hypothetical protein